MSRHYKVFTEINFTHNYYATGICGDIAVQPTDDTAALLRKYRMLWGAVNRKVPSSYQLLREQVDTMTPLIDLPANFRLRFELMATHKDFMNFTDFMNVPAKTSKEIFLFENQASGSNLTNGSYTKMELVGDVVQVTVPGPTTQPVSAHQAGSPDTFTTDSFEQGGVWIARIKLQGQPLGVYTISWSGGSKAVYYDPSLVGKGLLGILHLDVSTSPVRTIGATYTHAFQARTAIWKYYVLLKAGLVTDVYTLTHTSLTFNRTNFLTGPPPPLTEPALAEAMAVSKINAAILFATTGPVAFQDVPRSLITLTRSSAPGTGIVVKNLANPALGDPTATVIVMVDPPLP